MTRLKLLTNDKEIIGSSINHSSEKNLSKQQHPFVKTNSLNAPHPLPTPLRDPAPQTNTHNNPIKNLTTFMRLPPCETRNPILNPTTHPDQIDHHNLLNLPQEKTFRNKSSKQKQKNLIKITISSSSLRDPVIK